MLLRSNQRYEKESVLESLRKIRSMNFYGRPHECELSSYIHVHVLSQVWRHVGKVTSLKGVMWFICFDKCMVQHIMSNSVTHGLLTIGLPGPYSHSDKSCILLNTTRCVHTYIGQRSPARGSMYTCTHSCNSAGGLTGVWKPLVEAHLRNRQQQLLKRRRSANNYH